MSASSSTSNTGPNRFRGDAASFSPSQPSAYQTYQQQQHPQQFHPQQLPQQYIQQQQQQQQMYMQYAPQYPMMVNHQMVYPPVYMPMYSQDMFYQNQPYLMPQQVPFSPNSHSPNINNNHMYGGGRNKSKVKRSNTSPYNPKAPPFPHNNTHHYDEPKKDSPPPPAPSTQAASTPVDEPSTPASSAPLSKPSKAIEKVPNDSKGDPRILNDNDTNETSNENINNFTATNEDAEASFPFYFSTNKDEFDTAKLVSSGLRRSLYDEKYQRLIQAITPHDQLIINTTPIRIIDHNTNSAKVVHEKPKEEKKKETLAEDQAPTTNWAAILQSSTPKRVVVPKRAASPVPVANGSSTVTPTATTVVGADDTDNFDIKNESVQPLGVLLLRIMFDANYSVFSDELPTFKINARGLTNTGNICYMNSVLQVILYCKPFNRLLRLIEEKSIGSLSKVSPTPLIDATIKFFNEFAKGEENEIKDTFSEVNKPISPDSFYMNLISHEKFLHLKWGQQEDAEEFLGYYLDGLNDEFLDAMRKLNTSATDSLIQTYANDNSDPEKVNEFKLNVKNCVKLTKKEKEETVEDEEDNEWNEVGSNNKKIHVKRTVEIEPSPITMIFGGQFKSVLTIPKSPTSNQFQKSITLDPFQHVQLDISETLSIEEAFVHLNNLEKISYKMTNTTKDIQIKKQTFIDNLPEILIIHLKRFSFLKEKEVGIEKLRKKIVYNHELHIPQEIISNKAAEDKNVYELIGVVYHHGISAEGGHYTCDVLHNDDEWIRIDDTLIRLITQDEVLNGGTEENIKNAYILLYARK